MTKRNRQEVQDRKQQRRERMGKVVKDKFQEEKAAKQVNIIPKNHNQKLYLDSLKRNKITVAKGSSGSGKTYVGCCYAGNKLLKGEVDKIILIRPYEQVGRSIGLRPGTSEEKLLPLMQSMLQPLEEMFGQGAFNYHLEHGNIVLEALEDIRGRSYSDAIVIVDEAQSCDMKTIQTLVTRLGENAQLILCGDGINWQVDIKGVSGLNWFTDTIKRLRKNIPNYLDKDDVNQLTNNIGIVHFTKDDVVRSGLTKMFVKVFDEESYG